MKKQLGPAALVGFLSLSALADPPRMVSVTGTCIRNVIPDRGAVTMTAESKDVSSKKTQVAASRLYEAIRGKVNALRLADAEVSTSEYTSEEVKEWEKSKLVSKGFRTRIGLRVETSDHARLSEVLEIGNREGITEMSGLQLFVSSKKMLEEKTTCLKEAAEQARTKADSLARALGAKLGEVLTIQENASFTPEPPRPMYKMEMARAADVAASGPTIEAGKSELTTTVNVSFGLK